MFKGSKRFLIKTNPIIHSMLAYKFNQSLNIDKFRIFKNK